MPTNLTEIKCKYITSENIECDSYDEARLVEVMRGMAGTYIEKYKILLLAKAILMEFEISLKMQEEIVEDVVLGPTALSANNDEEMSFIGASLAPSFDNTKT